jgi:tripartite-type tricarboxylate transporter receptor subunit TctC
LKEIIVKIFHGYLMQINKNLLILFIWALLLIPVSINAQNYPTKSVRIITPTAAGGSLDTITRIIGAKLSESFNQQFIIDNRPGAGGMLGVEVVAKSAPDGYTLLVASNGNIATTQALYKNVPYDPIKDFSPIILFSETPYVLVTHISLPVKSISEFIKFAKLHPKKINYSSSGNGSTPHLAAELFVNMTGLDLVHIPYKGSTAALNGLLTGEVVFKITGLPLAYPFIKNNRIRALAVASTKRSTNAPEIPTVHESGLPNYFANSWSGMLAPYGISMVILNKLNAEMLKIINYKDVKKLLNDQGFETLGGSPEEFSIFLKLEIIKWDKVIKKSKAKID